MKKAKAAKAASRSPGSGVSKAPGKEETFALGQTLLEREEFEGALVTWQPLYGLYKTEFDAHCRALAERVLGRIRAGTVKLDGMAREQRLSLYLVARRTHPAHEATASLRSHALGALWTSGTLADLDLLATLVDSDKALSSSERLSVMGKLRALNANARSRITSHTTPYATTNTAGVAGGAQSAAYILSAAATEFSAQGLNAEAMKGGLFYTLASIPCADDEATHPLVMTIVENAERGEVPRAHRGEELHVRLVRARACTDAERLALPAHRAAHRVTSSTPNATPTS